MARLPGSCASTLGWKISSTSPMARCTYNSWPSLETMPAGVEAQIGEVRGFGMAENAEDTAFVVKMIVELILNLHAIRFFSPITSFDSSTNKQIKLVDKNGTGIASFPLQEPSRSTTFTKVHASNPHTSAFRTGHAKNKSPRPRINQMLRAFASSRKTRFPSRAQQILHAFLDPESVVTE